MYLKTVLSSVTTLLFLDNGDIISSRYDIANSFNNYFASIAETTKNIYIHINIFHTLLHDWCFSVCSQSCKSCFYF